jgi:hypothetical protein
MSCDCCTSTPARSAHCPACRQPGETVSTTTLLHQLATPWQQRLDEGAYYFCNQPGCAVVYFSDAGERFSSEALRQPAGQKSAAAGRTLCYCFDIRFSDLSDAAAAKQCREFVINQTRNKVCACEQRNPSGRCCLRDFPHQEE